MYIIYDNILQAQSIRHTCYFSCTCFKSANFLELNDFQVCIFWFPRGNKKHGFKCIITLRLIYSICFDFNSLIAVCLGDSDPRRMSTSKRHFEKTNTICRPSNFIKYCKEPSDSPRESRPFTRTGFWNVTK